MASARLMLTSLALRFAFGVDCELTTHHFSPIVSFVAPYPVGWLVDRIGARIVLIAGFTSIAAVEAAFVFWVSDLTSLYIGLILFNPSSPENPNFDIRMRARKQDPDMFYTNKYLELVEKDKQAHVKGSHKEKIDKDLSQQVGGKRNEKVKTAYALEAGTEIHLKARLL